MAAAVKRKRTSAVRMSPMLKTASLIVNLPTLSRLGLPKMAAMSGLTIALDERRDHGGERGADDDSDREVDDVAAHDEVLETLEHGRVSQIADGPVRARP